MKRREFIALARWRGRGSPFAARAQQGGPAAADRRGPCVCCGRQAEERQSRL